jgi:hypothetical protein
VDHGPTDAFGAGPPGTPGPPGPEEIDQWSMVRLWFGPVRAGPSTNGLVLYMLWSSHTGPVVLVWSSHTGPVVVVWSSLTGLVLLLVLNLCYACMQLYPLRMKPENLSCYSAAQPLGLFELARFCTGRILSSIVVRGSALAMSLPHDLQAPSVVHTYINAEVRATI